LTDFLLFHDRWLDHVFALSFKLIFTAIMLAVFNAVELEL